MADPNTPDIEDPNTPDPSPDDPNDILEPVLTTLLREWNDRMRGRIAAGRRGPPNIEFTLDSESYAQLEDELLPQLRLVDSRAFNTLSVKTSRVTRGAENAVIDLDPEASS